VIGPQLVYLLSGCAFALVALLVVAMVVRP